MTSVISSAVHPRLFCRGLTVDFEEVSKRSCLFGKSGAGKTTTLLAFLGSILGGGSQVYLVDSKNELPGFLASTTCL